MSNCSENNGTGDFPALQWQVPQNPYGVLGGVLLIILFASVISVCSLRKLEPLNNNEQTDHIDLSTHPSSVMSYKEEAEKVVVLMPGDEQPTFIAQPTSVIESTLDANVGGGHVASSQATSYMEGAYLMSGSSIKMCNTLPYNKPASRSIKPDGEQDGESEVVRS